MTVVLLDFADSAVKGDKATEDFWAMIKVSSEKVSRKKRPTIFLKGDNRVAQVPVANFCGNAAFFDQSFRRETGLTPINSVKDLAD